MVVVVAMAFSLAPNPVSGIKSMAETGARSQPVLQEKTAFNEHVKARLEILQAAPVYPAARTLEVVATGYAKGDGSGETTFTGSHVRWGVVAVDPKVIPLGSWIRVDLSGSEPPMAAKVSSTVFRAEDTGRLIQGDHVDIWFPKLQMALDWGVRRVTIAVIPPKTGSAPS
ncbi:MAG TPA: 3D domain-containing protein [Candidatus Tyrphobacter sp.]|nr:3D domain-containing protein [Candidatus Tyrphobacter sp.]